MKMLIDHSQDADDDRIMALKRFSRPISLNRARRERGERGALTLIAEGGGGV